MPDKEDNRIWHLLARKMAKEILPEEDKELDKLMQENPHAAYSRELINIRWRSKQKSYDQEDISELLEKHKKRLLDADPINIPSKISSEPTIKKLILRYSAVAATVLLIAFAGWKWWQQSEYSDNKIVLEQLTTQKGSRSQIILSDGTKVWVNSGSRLNYPKQFDGKTREVELEGEAFFEVTKNDAKPFFVHTKTFNVKVVGTAFNVRAYAEEASAETSLIHGSVEIHFNGSKDKMVILHPNEKLIVSAPVKKIQESAAKNADTNIDQTMFITKASVTTEDSTITETAWVDNKLVFKNMSFDKTARELEKWFGVEIRFKNPDKKELNLRGKFEGESLDEILQSFQLTGKSFKYYRDENGVIWIQ